MVVHEPGEWFETTLAALAAQDYPNFRCLFLITPDDEAGFADTSARIRAVIPSAFIRHAPSNGGFGPNVNEVLRLVEGDNGLFLVCHDDIAPAPDAVRMMAAELFRSNAGIVGPKLVEWHEPRVLQHVGLDLDRFGEADSLVEPGEVDQEQHDAVRDVFVVPSACFLVRADLFRALGGFDPSISFYGEDVDLCWRAHHTGARVIVAPDAVVRHREALAARRPDLAHRTLQARHRVRTVATLTGASRLLGRSVQLVLLTLAELVVGLFTGRVGEAFASLRALLGLIPATPRIIARRRQIRGQRMVPEREVLGLQNRGSARLTSYLRGRETTTFVGEEATVRRWRQASFGPTLAWFVFLLAVVIGGRNLIRHGVPAVGEFLPFPSAGDLWSSYRDAFDSRGFGATAAAPTGWAATAILSVVTLFRMPLMQTVTVIGLHVLGGLGAWRLATVFPVSRARIAGMVLYVGTPFVPGVFQTGDLSALILYAALPWLVHETRLAAGLATADPLTAATDLTDGVVDPGLRGRLRAVAIGALLLGVTLAFVPAAVVVWPLTGLLLALGTLLAASAWRVAAWIAGATVVTTLVGVVLNLPWVFEWDGATLVGARGAGSTGRSLAEIASLAPTTERFAVLGLALYFPVLAALAIARAWRLTWAIRAALLVVVFATLMVLGERGTLDQTLPATSLLAVPVVLGLALAAAAIAGGFDSDVLARGFGWRQPLFVLAHVAMIVGLIPAAVAVGNGSWHIERTPLARLYASQFPADTAGDYRVLFVGDPRALPVPGRAYADGIAFAVVDSGTLDLTDRFQTPATAGDDAVVEALDLIAEGSTLRAGRLLAPLGIRYVVIPLTNGSTSTTSDPIAPPQGLIAALGGQLDLGVVRGQPSLAIFSNRAWIPVGAQLTGPTAEASRQGGADALVRADLGAAVVSMLGIDSEPEAAWEVAPGVVHVAIPYDPRLTLSIDGGEEVAARPGFGVTTAFDIEHGGVGRIRYETDAGRRWWLAGQAALWLAVLGVAAAAHTQFGRRRTVDVLDETLIDFGAGDLPDVGGPGGGIVGEALVAAAPPDADPAAWLDDVEAHGGTPQTDAQVVDEVDEEDRS